jgi:BioD-like phosphotransacetylase family protein
MPPTIVYLTGFRQHAGKTVASLGIISRLRRVMDPSRIAYLKPVGQEMVRLADGTVVDKDAEILERFASLPGFDMGSVSPVRLGAGFTQEYLASANRLQETRRLEDTILASIAKLADRQVVVAEGSGHPGVGGIVGLSNADVANLMGAGVVFLSGGGIGKALDMLEVDLSYFLYKKTPVRGVLFNRCIPEKVAGMSRLITEELLNSKYGAFGGRLRILGFLPEIPDLGRPSMRAIAERYDGAEPLGSMNGEAWEVPCAVTRIISMDADRLRLERYLQPRDVVMVAANSRRRTRMVLDYHRSHAADSPLGGLVFTCGRTDSLDPGIRSEIIAAGLPSLLVPDDTAVAEELILGIYENTKLEPWDTRKIREVEELFSEHFDAERFLEAFAIRGQ